MGCVDAAKPLLGAYCLSYRQTTPVHQAFSRTKEGGHATFELRPLARWAGLFRGAGKPLPETMSPRIFYRSTPTAAQYPCQRHSYVSPT